MTPDAPFVDVTIPSGGVRRGKLQPRRVPAVANVIHTTGAGPLRRATEPRYRRWRKRWGVPEGDVFLAALQLYAQMNASGHYVICGDTGRLGQTVPEDLCAWHVGSRGARPYITRLEGRRWMKGDDRFAWWAERWPELSSPAELAGGLLWEPYQGWPGLWIALSGGLRGSCNANTYGIEVVPRLEDPRGPWSPEAWDTLVRLCLDLHDRREVQLRRDTVLSHSDVHPLSRTTARGEPWDPRPEQWSWPRMRQALRAHGSPPECNGPAAEA